MTSHFPSAKLRGAIVIAPAAAILVLLGGCNDGHEMVLSGERQPHLTSFKEMARQAPCTDARNRLFLIDGQQVLWDRASDTCGDMAYEQALFGETPQDALCRFFDSYSGPTTVINAPEYAAMFDVLIHHLEDPRLGLGPDHTVVPIPF